MHLQKTVFITGASSGFGEACAHKFASNQHRLILSARRKEKLENLTSLLRSKYATEIHLLPFDVRDRNATLTAIHSLPEAWQQIDILINNAGLAAGKDDSMKRTWMTGMKWLTQISKALHG